MQHFATQASAAESLSGALIPPSTRLAVGQIGRESRFTVKRSICLSNEKKKKKKKDRDIQARADVAIVHKDHRAFLLLMYAARCLIYMSS